MDPEVGVRPVASRERSSLAVLPESHRQGQYPRCNETEQAWVGGGSPTPAVATQRGRERAFSQFRVGSGSQPLVAMMKSTDLREGDDLAPVGRLCQARLRTVLFEGQVGPGLVIIPQVG